MMNKNYAVFWDIHTGNRLELAMVEQHGGQVSADCKSQNGSYFGSSFPLLVCASNALLELAHISKYRPIKEIYK
jgi:hypothetical protein